MYLTKPAFVKTLNLSRVPTLFGSSEESDPHQQRVYPGPNRRFDPTHPKPRYQPYGVVWAEANVILVDEFRDGNVGTSALQPSMQKWRPATLRYRLLNQAGRIVEHTRQLVLRLPWVDDLVELCRRCRERLWQESPVGPVLQTEG